MKRFVLVLVLLLLLVGVACTAQQKETAIKVVERVGQAAPIAAKVVASTPIGPVLAPILAGISALCTGIVLVARGKKEGGDVMATVPTVEVVPSMLKSRKTKLVAIGTVLEGVIAFAVVQWNLPETVAAVLMAAIAWIVKGNIDGIATEDAASKSNGK